MLAAVLALAAPGPAGCDPGDACGPAEARVTRVVDGDTLDVAGGERVRLLGVDAPEAGSPPECGALEAREFLAARVEGRDVELSYETACRDGYGRLLAHVFVDGESAGRALLDAGFACPLFLAPNLARREAFTRAAQVARARGLGVWGNCSPLPCE